MSDELKPCPICGAAPESPSGFIVHKGSCYFRMAYQRAVEVIAVEFIDAWNTRTPDYQTRALEDRAVIEAQKIQLVEQGKMLNISETKNYELQSQLSTATAEVERLKSCYHMANTAYESAAKERDDLLQRQKGDSLA